MERKKIDSERPKARRDIPAGDIPGQVSFSGKVVTMARSRAAAEVDIDAVLQVRREHPPAPALSRAYEFESDVRR